MGRAGSRGRGDFAQLQAVRDRGRKREWYRQYGVREYWLVDLYDDSVTIVDFSGAAPLSRYAKGTDAIRSTVLPDLELSAFGVFS